MLLAQPQPLPTLGPGTQAPNLTPRNTAQLSAAAPSIANPSQGGWSQATNGANPFGFSMPWGQGLPWPGVMGNAPAWGGLPAWPLLMPPGVTNSPWQTQPAPGGVTSNPADIHNGVGQPEPEPEPAPAPPEAPLQGSPLWFGQGTQQMYRDRSSAFNAEVHNRSRPEAGMGGSNLGFRSSGPPRITRIAQPANWLDRYRASR